MTTSQQHQQSAHEEVGVGQEQPSGLGVARALAPLGEVTACGRDDADFSQTQELVGLLRKLQPGFAANAAVYLSVDRAETEPDLGLINVEVAGVLASEEGRIRWDDLVLGIRWPKLDLPYRLTDRDAVAPILARIQGSV